MSNNSKTVHKPRVSKSRQVNGTNGVSSEAPKLPRFSTGEIGYALIETFDLMQRGLLDNKFVVAGQVAKCMKDNRPLEADYLEVIVAKRHVTPEVKSMLMDFATKNITDDGFEWKAGNVPVRVKFLKNNYDYFDFPDRRVHGPEAYNIPNQFAKYWEEKDKLS